MRESGTWTIAVGSSREASEKAVELANKEEGIFASVGLHPIHSSVCSHDPAESDCVAGVETPAEEFDYDFYKKLAADKKVVAIGECGLDFFHLDETTKDLSAQAGKQKKIFLKQIELANEIGKPLMLHIRDGYKDALEIIKKHAKVKGNVHFFAGDLKTAKEFLDLGFTLSFTGVITYPPKVGVPDYAEIIKNIPIEMIMAETDAPYVAPMPYRGKRNEPVFVSEVVKKIAEIKGLPVEETASILVANARRVFKI